jgi:hypothetical protein
MGHKVVWDFPLYASKAKKIFVSCIFKENRKHAEEYEMYGADIGGSGYDLKSKLPPEIEAIKPRINLGYTMRGCIRNCEFCVVPEKEGKARPVGDLLDLWDKQSKNITLYDNNILALPEHFELVCKQAREKKITIEFNQGLDHRLLTDDVCKTIKQTRMKYVRFAYDKPEMVKTADRAFDLLASNSIKNTIWYVLTGHETTLEDDLKRLNHIRDRGHLAFVQRYEKHKWLVPVSRWANTRGRFRKQTFEDFLKQEYDINFSTLIYESQKQAGTGGEKE